MTTNDIKDLDYEKFLYDYDWFQQKRLALNMTKNRENTEYYHENVLKIGWKWKNQRKEIMTYKVLPPAP